MYYKGISYDIGTEYLPNILTRDNLNEDMVSTDMDAIKNKYNSLS